MTIEIITTRNKYEIDVDGTALTLNKFGTVTDVKSDNYGEVTRRAIGYFTQLPNAVNRIIKEEFGDIDATVSLKEFLTQYEAIKSEIMGQLEPGKL